jgi:hypothetical protein
MQHDHHSSYLFQGNGLLQAAFPIEGRAKAFAPPESPRLSGRGILSIHQEQ